MRTVTPDDAQAKAMVSMLEKLGSDYIQILYSEEAYGEGGRDKVKNSHGFFNELRQNTTGKRGQVK